MSYQGTGPPTEGSYGAGYGDYNAAQAFPPYGAAYGQYYNNNVPAGYPGPPQPSYLYAGSQLSYGATMEPQGVPYTYTHAAAEHWGPPPTAEGYDPRQPYHLGADSHGQASVDSSYSSSHSRAGDRKSQAANDADPKREKSSSKGSDKLHSGSSRDDRISSRNEQTTSRDDRISSRNEQTTSRDDLAISRDSHHSDDQAGSRERHFRGDQDTSRDGHPRDNRADSRETHSRGGDEKKSDADLEADLLSRLDIESLLQDERLRNVLFAGISKATTKLEQTLKTTDKKVKNDASIEDSSSRLKPQQSAQTSADAPQKPKSILKRKTEEKVEVESKTIIDSSKNKTSTDPFSNLSALERTLHLLRGKTSMVEVRESETGSRGSEKPPTKPTGALRQLESYNDSGDEEHAEKDTKTQTKTKNAQSTQPFWAVDAIPAVEEKSKDNTLPDIQEQMYEQWRQSINQSSNVREAAAKEQDVSKVSQVFQKPEQAHNLASSSQTKRVGDKDDEELDSTVQNILQSIGFNFDLSKRMQELARQKKKQGGLDSEIDQSASFLGQSEGLVQDVRAALFSDRQEKAQLDSLIQEAKVNMEKRSSGYHRSPSSDAYSAETHRSKKKIGGKWESPEPGDDKMVIESRESRSEQTLKMLKNQDWEDLSSDEDSMGVVDSRKFIEKTKRQPNERHADMRQQPFSRDREEASPPHNKVLLEGARKSKNMPRDSHEKSLWLSERFRDGQEDEYFYPGDSEVSNAAALLAAMSSKRKKKSSGSSKSLKLSLHSGSGSTHMENLRVTSRAVHDDIEDGEHFSQSRRVIVSSKSDVRIAPHAPVLRKSQSPEIKVPRKRPASPLQSPVPKERRVFSEKQSSSDLHDFLIRSLEQNAPEICQALGLDLDAYYKSTLAQTVFSKLNASGRARSPIMNEYLRRDSVRKSPDKQILRSSSRQLSRSPDRRASMSPVRHASRSQDRQSSRSSDKRRSWSPDRHRSKSVEGRKSRSPARPKAKSPVKATSPARRRSRSPARRGSRSPVRRRSRSPVRRRSRSPVRRRSRSPDRRRSRSPRESSSRARSPGRRTKLPERQRPPIRDKNRAPKKLAGTKKWSYLSTNRDTDTGKSELPAKGVLSKMSDEERKAYLQKLLDDKAEQMKPEQVKALPKEVVKDPSRKPETEPQKGAEEQQDDDPNKIALKKDIKLAVENLRNFPVDERKIILIQMTQMSGLERCNLLDDISAKQVKVGLLKAKMLKLTKEQSEMMKQSGLVNANLHQLTKIKKAIASVDEELQRLLKASFYIPQLEKTDVPEKAVFKKPQAMKATAKMQKQQVTERSKVLAESEGAHGKLAAGPRGSLNLNSGGAQMTSGQYGDSISPTADGAGEPVGGSSSTTVGRHADKSKDERRDGQVPSAPQFLPSREKVYYEYYDSGNHWCKHCSCNFSSLEQLLQHNHTKKHLTLIQTHKKPWKTSEEKQMKRKVGLSRSRQIKGAEMMSPVMGFYCNLCQEFFGDIEDSTEHLKDDRHYDQYMEFVKRNPQYEKSLLLEKTGVHVASKTLIQWTYPQPPPREVKKPQPPLPQEAKLPQPPLTREVKKPQPPLPLKEVNQYSHDKADSDQPPKVKVSRKNLRVKDSETGDKDIIEIVDMDLEKEEEAVKEDVVKVPKMSKPSTVLPPWIPQIPEMPRPELDMKQTKEDDNRPLGEFLSIEQQSSQFKQVHLPVLVIPEFDYLDEIPLPEPEESSPLMEIPLPEESDIPLPEESDIPLPEEDLDTSEEPILMYTAKSLQQVKEVEKSIEDEKRLMGGDNDAGVEKLVTPGLVTTPAETEALLSDAAQIKGAENIKKLKQQKSIDDEKRMMGIDVDSDIEKPLSAVLVKPPPVAQSLLSDAAQVKDAKDLKQLDETVQAVGDGKQKVDIDKAKMSTPTAASQGESIVSTPVAANQNKPKVSTSATTSPNEPKVKTVGAQLITDTGKVGQQEVAPVDSARSTTSGPTVAESNITIGDVKDVVEKLSTKSSDMLDKEERFEKPTITVSDQNSKTVTGKSDIEVDVKVTSLSFTLAAVTGQTEFKEKDEIPLPEVSSPLLEIPLQEESDIPLPEELDIPLPEELDISLPEESDIPLPEESDIPLPEESDIPLPEESDIPLPEESDIPLPEESDIPLPEESGIPLPEESDIHLPGNSSPPPEVSTPARVIYQAHTQMDVTGQTVDSEKDKIVTGQAVDSEMVKSVTGQGDTQMDITGQTVDSEKDTGQADTQMDITGHTVGSEMVKCVTGQTVDNEVVKSVTGQADTQMDVTYQAVDSQKCKSISTSAVESQNKAVPGLAEKRKKETVDTVIIIDSSEDEKDLLIGDKPPPAKQAKLATSVAASQDKAKITQAKKVSTSTAVKVSSPAVVKVSTQATEQVSTSEAPKVSTPTAAKVSTPTTGKASTPTATKVSTPTAAKVSAPTATKVSTPTATKVSTPTAAKVSTPMAGKASTPTATQVSTPAASKVSTPTAAETTATKVSTPAAAEATATKVSTPTAAEATATFSIPTAAEATATKVSTLAASKVSTPTAAKATTTKVSTPAAAEATATKVSTPAASKASTPSTAKASTPAASAQAKAKVSTPAAAKVSVKADSKVSTPAAAEATATKVSTPATAKASTPAASAQAKAKVSTPTAATVSIKADSKVSTPTAASQEKTFVSGTADKDTTKVSIPPVDTQEEAKVSTPAATKIFNSVTAFQVKAIVSAPAAGAQDEEKASTPTDGMQGKAAGTQITEKVSTPAAATQAKAKVSTPAADAKDKTGVTTSAVIKVMTPTATKDTTAMTEDTTRTTTADTTQTAAIITTATAGTQAKAKVSTPATGTQSKAKTTTPSDANVTTPSTAKVTTTTKVCTSTTLKVTTPTAKEVTTPVAANVLSPTAASQDKLKVATSVDAKVATPATKKVTTLTAANMSTPAVISQNTLVVSAPAATSKNTSVVSTPSATSQNTSVVSAPAVISHNTLVVSTPAATSQNTLEVSTPAATSQNILEVSTPAATSQNTSVVTAAAATSQIKPKVSIPAAAKDSTSTVTSVSTSAAAKPFTPTATSVSTSAAAKPFTPTATSVSTSEAAKPFTPTATSVSTSAAAKPFTPTATSVSTSAAAKPFTPTATSKKKTAPKTADPRGKDVSTSAVGTQDKANVSTPTTSQNTVVVSSPLATSQNTVVVSSPLATSQNTVVVSSPIATSQNTVIVSSPIATSQNTVIVSSPIATSQNTVVISSPIATSQNTVVVSSPIATGQNTAEVSTPIAKIQEDRVSIVSVFDSKEGKDITATEVSIGKEATGSTENRHQETKTNSTVGKLEDVQCPTAGSHEDISGRIEASTASPTVSSIEKAVFADPVAGSQKVADVVSSVAGNQKVADVISLVAGSQKVADVVSSVAGSQKVADVVSSVDGSKKEPVTPTVSGTKEEIGTLAVSGTKEEICTLAVSGTKEELDTFAVSGTKEETGTLAASVLKKDMGTSAVSDCQEEKLNNTHAGTDNKEDKSSDDNDVDEPSHGDNGVKQNRQDVPDENVQTKKSVKSTVSKTSKKQTPLEDTGGGDFKLASASVEEGSCQIVVEEVTSDSQDKPEITIGATRGRGRGRKPKSGPDRQSAAMSKVRVNVELLKVVPETVTTSRKAGSQKLSSTSQVDLTSASPVLSRSAKKIREAASNVAESPGRVTRSRTKKEDTAEKEDSELAEEEPLCQHRPAVLKREESSDSDTTITDETEGCLAQLQSAASRDSVSGRKRSKKSAVSEKEGSMGGSSPGTG